MDDNPKTEAENHDAKIHIDPDDAAPQAPLELTTEQVRQGHTGDHARYILGLSFGIAFVLLLIVVWIATH
jgi:hypothetical protein